MNFLIGGIVGGIVAALFSALYTYRMHQVRLRSEATLEVVAWVDDVYDRLVTIYAQREAVFTGKPFGLSNDEYRSTVKEAKAMLLSSKMHTRIALVYGQGRELGMFDKLREEFIGLTETLLAAEKETWEATNKELNQRLTNSVEPLKEAVEKVFLASATVVSVTRDFVKDNIPTLYLSAPGDKGRNVLIHKIDEGKETAHTASEIMRLQLLKFGETLLAITRVIIGCVLIGVFVWVCAGMPDLRILAGRFMYMAPAGNFSAQDKDPGKIEPATGGQYAKEGDFGAETVFPDTAAQEIYQKASAGNAAGNFKSKK